MGRKRRERRRPAKNEARAAAFVEDQGGGPEASFTQLRASPDRAEATPAAEVAAESARARSREHPDRGLPAWARVLQVEDLILFAWIVLVQRLIESQFGEHLHAVATL